MELLRKRSEAAERIFVESEPLGKRTAREVNDVLTRLERTPPINTAMLNRRRCRHEVG